jgi:hypothetical protein
MMWLKQAKVPRSTYETAIGERDAFEEEVKRLQQQVSVLVINEDVLRRCALRAIALLQRVDTARTGGVAFKQEIDTLVGEARSAGLIEEAK